MSPEVQAERNRCYAVVAAIAGHCQAVVLRNVLHGVQQGMSLEDLAAKYGPPWTLAVRSLPSP